MKIRLTAYEKTLRRSVYGIVRRAIRAGVLVRQPCVICGDPRGHAHHENYDYPLEVTWICHAHHMAWHAEKRLQHEGEMILYWQREALEQKPYETHIEYDPEYLHAIRDGRLTRGIAGLTLCHRPL